MKDEKRINELQKKLEKMYIERTGVENDIYRKEGEFIYENFLKQILDIEICYI